MLNVVLALQNEEPDVGLGHARLQPLLKELQKGVYGVAAFFRPRDLSDVEDSEVDLSAVILRGGGRYQRSRTNVNCSNLHSTQRFRKPVLQLHEL